MLFLLSPAKSLDYDTPAGDLPHTLPLFARQSAQLIAVLKKQVAGAGGPADGPERFAGRRSMPRATRPGRRVSPPATRKQAVLAFDGDVYDGLAAKTLEPADLDWAQEHLLHPERPVRRAAPAGPDAALPAGDGHAAGRSARRRTSTSSGAAADRRLPEPAAGRRQDAGGREPGLAGILPGRWTAACSRPGWSTACSRNGRAAATRSSASSAKKARGLMARYAIAAPDRHAP